MTRWDGLPARRWWHVRAVCCRRTRAPLVIKCIYLREGKRGPLAWHWSSKWPLVIVIHHHHGVGTEEKDEGRGKQRKPPDLFLHTHRHTLLHQTRPPAWRPIHKHLRQHSKTRGYASDPYRLLCSRHTTSWSCNSSQKSTMNVKVKEL